MKLTSQYLIDLIQPCIDDGYRVNLTDGRDNLYLKYEIIRSSTVYIIAKPSNCGYTKERFVGSTLEVNDIELVSDMIANLKHMTDTLKSDGYKFDVTISIDGYFAIEIHNHVDKIEESIIGPTALSEVYIKDMLQVLSDDGVDYEINREYNSFIINFGKSILASPLWIASDNSVHSDNLCRDGLSHIGSIAQHLPNIMKTFLDDGYSSRFDARDWKLKILPKPNRFQISESLENQIPTVVLSEQYLNDIFQSIVDDGMNILIIEEEDYYLLQLHTESDLINTEELDHKTIAYFKQVLFCLETMINDGMDINLYCGAIDDIRIYKPRNLSESVKTIDDKYMGRYYKFKCRDIETGDDKDILISLVNTTIDVDKINLTFVDKLGKSYTLLLDKFSTYIGYDKLSDKFSNNLTLSQRDNEWMVVDQFFIKPINVETENLISYVQQQCS